MIVGWPSFATIGEALAARSRRRLHHVRMIAALSELVVELNGVIEAQDAHILELRRQVLSHKRFARDLTELAIDSIEHPSPAVVEHLRALRREMANATARDEEHLV